MKRICAYVLCLMMLFSLLSVSIADSETQNGETAKEEVVMPWIEADPSMSGLVISQGTTAQFKFIAHHGTVQRARYQFRIYIYGTTTLVSSAYGEVTADTTELTITWDTLNVQPRQYNVEAYMEYFNTYSNQWIRAIAEFASFNVTVEGNLTVSGQCGPNLGCRLYEDHELRIFGTGDMYDDVYFAGILYPHSVDEVQSVVIESGVTNISDYAFEYFKNLKSVDISDTVVSMGYGAFYGCSSLPEISLPSKLTALRDQAFRGCSALEEISIPNSIVEIGSYAFGECSKLKSVYYIGTKSMFEQKLEPNIETGNTFLQNAHWYFFSETIENAKVEWNAEDVKFKGSTAYVIANGSAKTPRFTVKNEDGSTINAESYDYEYLENINAGTGYVIVTFKGDYVGSCRGSFKIYLPATTETTVANVSNGIKLTWSPVEGAAGYVIYRRAWSSTTNGWTTFERWNNTTELNWTDTKVYAGTRYQYGVKAYFAQRVDPVSGATIGGNVGDNFNLGEVGPLKTTVRITTRVLNSVTAGKKQI